MRTTSLPSSIEGFPLPPLYDSEDAAIIAAADAGRQSGHFYAVRAVADAFRIVWHGCHIPHQLGQA